VADGPVLLVDDLPVEARRAADNGPAPFAAEPGYEAFRWGVQAEREARDRRERDSLLRALATANGNKAEAARLLGMARSTLLSRLKKHALLADRD
jgi:transcriptional regulator of acetoin/glycerol metabolism